MHQRQSPPEWSAGKGSGGSPAVLEVQIAIGERDDADSRLPDQLDRGSGAGVILHRQAAAMAADHRQAETVPQDRLGHEPETLRLRVAAFVHVEIHPDAALPRDREQAVELGGQLCGHQEKAAQRARPVVEGEVGQPFCLRGKVVSAAAQRHGLKRDATRPLSAELSHDGVAAFPPLGAGVDMRPDHPRTVRPGGAQREAGSTMQISFGPVRLVIRQGLQRPREGAGPVGRSVPGMGLVEVHMGVHEAGKHQGSARVELAGQGLETEAAGIGVGDGGNPSSLDRHIAEHGWLQGIDGRASGTGGKQGSGNAGAADDEHRDESSSANPTPRGKEESSRR